tara:strand:+ start:2192 stop:2536 length:345 start_codon:yes stop_codon:yes gene_type:complete
MRITRDIIFELADQEARSRIKPHWTESHVSKIRYQIRQSMLGLCRYCPEPVSSEKSIRCDYHLKQRRQENIQLKKEGRCHACGIKLRAEVGEAYRCHACKERHAISQRRYNKCN